MQLTEVGFIKLHHLEKEKDQLKNSIHSIAFFYKC